MSELNVKPNVTKPDDVYELLIQMHEGLSEDQSTRANAALILLLINHIGDAEVIEQAIAIAGKQID